MVIGVMYVVGRGVSHDVVTTKNPLAYTFASLAKKARQLVFNIATDYIILLHLN